MEYYEIVEIVEGLQYRPGWSFNIQDGFIYIKAVVPDSNGKSLEATLFQKMDIERYLMMYEAKDMLLRDILSAIESLEAHERIEWFKLNGSNVYDPHPNGLSGPLRISV